MTSVQSEFYLEYKKIVKKKCQKIARAYFYHIIEANCKKLEVAECNRFDHFCLFLQLINQINETLAAEIPNIHSNQ